MNKDFNIKFGQRIKELRLADKMTQEQLAEKLDMERSNLAKIEAGSHFPSAENLEKFVLIFNISPAELFNTQHFKSREDLKTEIISALDTFDIDKLRYIHKSVMNLKILK